jgi:hypothetical protein
MSHNTTYFLSPSLYLTSAVVVSLSDAGASSPIIPPSKRKERKEKKIRNIQYIQKMTK